MRKLFYLFFLASSTVLGQTANDTISNDIKSIKTAKHTNIPGTRLYIIPPEGFTVANTFTGLQKGDNTGINIVDLIGGNYYTNAATFNKESFEEKGAKVFDYRGNQNKWLSCQVYFRAGRSITKGVFIGFWRYYIFGYVDGNVSSFR